MNLLLLNHELPPIGGGAGNATWFLAKALLAEGHVVHIVTARFGNLPTQEECDGIHIVRLRCLRRRADRSNSIEMMTFVAAAMAQPSRLVVPRPDAVIAFFSIPAGIVAWLMRWRWNVPYVVSLRGGDVPGLVPEIRWMHRLLAPLRRRVLADSHAVVANSASLAAAAERADRVPAKVVHNGVDTCYFAPCRKRGGGEARVLFVGRLHRQKNLYALISSFAAACTGMPLNLAIVGDGPERASLVSHAQHAGCAEQIEWHGWVDKSTLKDLYRSAAIFVNPSLYEGMPNTVLEAMSCALPVIASRIGGHAELIQDGQTGLLFDVDKPQQLTDALVRLGSAPSLRAYLGLNARALVCAEFSWDAAAREYLSILGCEIHALGQ